MKSEPITAERIDELLRFLPLFSHPAKELEPEWEGGVVSGWIEYSRKGALTQLRDKVPEAYLDTNVKTCGLLAA